MSSVMKAYAKLHLFKFMNEMDIEDSKLLIEIGKFEYSG